MKNIWRIIYCLPYGLIIYGMTIKDWDGFIYLIMLSLFYSFLLMCAITMLQQIVLACNHTSFAYEIVLFSIIVYMISVKNDEVVLYNRILNLFHKCMCNSIYRSFNIISGKILGLRKSCLWKIVVDKFKNLVKMYSDDAITHLLGFRPHNVRTTLLGFRPYESERM